MQIPIPLLKRDIGLGGLVKKGLSLTGTRPCGGCKKREKVLDRAVLFVGTKKNASRRV